MKKTYVGEEEFQVLRSRFLSGRNRTDRTTPSAFNDVAAGIDLAGDFKVDATGAYFLVNDAGTLKWAKITVNVAF